MFKTIIVILSILISGCAVKKDTTFIQPYVDDRNYVKVQSDSETTMTDLGLLGMGIDLKVMSKNYIYSLALSAYATKELGYSYFTIKNITGDGELKKIFKLKKATTVEQRINACTDKSTGITFLPPKAMEDPYMLCNSIVLRDYSLYSFGFRERHLPIQYFIHISNKPVDKYLSFSADEVLNNSQVKNYILQHKELFKSDNKQFKELNSKVQIYKNKQIQQNKE